MVVRTNFIHASGVYELKYRNSRKRYIGSSNDLKSRKRGHLRLLRKHDHNKYLQPYYDLNGEKELQFGIIEFCSRNELIVREQFYIDLLRPEFNIRRNNGFREYKLKRTIPPKSVWIKRGDYRPREILLKSSTINLLQHYSPDLASNFSPDITYPYELRK